MSTSYNINEESFHLLVENVRDYAIFVLDAEGIIKSWNKGAEQIKGYRAEEVIGKPVSIFYTDEDLQKDVPRLNLKQAAESGRYENEGWRVRKDKSVFWADVVITVIKEKDDVIRGYLKITRDFTELKHRTDELSANRQFLDSILENIPNMVFVKDAKDLRFVRFNRAGEQLLGYSRIDLIGKNDYDFFPKEQADFFIKKDQHVLAEGDVVDIPEEPIATTKGERWLHTRKIPILNEKGEPTYLLGISEDITERRRVEEHILQLNMALENKIDELEKSNKELESFSYSVSHDLRTPLRAIHGYTSILSESYKKSMDEDGKRMMTSIINNARKMGQLIDDLLAFSRIGKKALQKAELNTKELVEHVVKELAVQVVQLPVIRIEAIHPCYADRTLLQQVYLNLIGNAIKYSRSTPQATIEIGSTDEGGEITFFVKDNGVGFDMRYYDKLFGVFQRLHTVEEFEGTGVGLALVKRIIERHEGRVWAKGSPGEGATFYFTLGTEVK